MSSPIFPPEIEIEILLRLPAKSLHRFKSVCKLWNFLISCDMYFYGSYIRYSIDNPKLLFLNHPIQNPNFTIAQTPLEPIVKMTNLPLPSNVFSGRNLKPVRIELVNCNSVYGYLCIVVYLGVVNGPIVECGMWMWNPSSSETVKLPKSDVTGLLDGPPMVNFYSGFGFDKWAMDYKVVRVVFTGSIRAVCEVYSIRRNCWRRLSGGLGILSNTFWASEMCTFVNGVGYWGVYTKESKDKFLILGFDFSTEKFKKIKVYENCIDGREKKFYSLWEYGGALAMSAIHFGGFESGSSQLYIWLLRHIEVEGSLKPCWSRLFDIDLECGPRRPIMSLWSGEVIMLGEVDGEHVLYNRAYGIVTKLNVFDVDHVVLYTENLSTLHGMMPKEDRNSSSSSDVGVASEIEKCSQPEATQHADATVEE